MGKETLQVTITRQFGTGGAYLGQTIARRLGCRYMDREIIRQAARQLGEEEKALADRDERLSSFWENLFRAFITGIPEAGYVPLPMHPIYDKDLFDAEAMIMNELADKHDAVIVGRAGSQVLKGRPGLASIFIHASMDFRVKRVMEVYKIAGSDEALSIIKDMDIKRGKFIRSMTGADWTDARNYHLSMDVSRVDFPSAEEMILKLVDNVKRKIG